jgi:hypothetical protein
MSDNTDQTLEILFAAARAAQPDTSRQEFGFETRFAARLREETRGSLSAWAWKLCPFFAAIALAVGWWNYSTLKSDTDAQIVVEAASANDDQTLLAYMTGERP